MKILIAEDNTLLAFMIEDVLQEAGHVVLGPAPSAARAREAVEGGLPDLALVDIDLQGDESGIDLARWLFGRGGTICIYATGQPEKADEGARYARGTLLKPFAPEEIRALVDALAAGEEPTCRAYRGFGSA